MAEGKRAEYLAFRAPDDMVQELARRAAAAGESMSLTIRRLLEQALKSEA